MSKKPITILGINPGTKYLAVALFRDSELREWSVKVFKGVWSREKMKRIITAVADMMGYYGVTVLVAKRLHPSRTSRNLNLLSLKIKDTAKQRGLKVLEYSIKELERSVCPEEKGNKKKLAERIALDYPVLFRELEKEKSNRNPYYVRLFEAVALGSVGHSHLDKTRK